MNDMRRSRLLLSLLGLISCTVPVTLSILFYFPLWIEAGGAETVSGAVLLLLVMAFVPIVKAVKKFLRSPSAYMMWLIAFLLFFALARIAEQMTVISFVGFVGNFVGAMLFRAAKPRERMREWDED